MTETTATTEATATAAATNNTNTTEAKTTTKASTKTVKIQEPEPEVEPTTTMTSTMATTLTTALASCMGSVWTYGTDLGNAMKEDLEDNGVIPKSNVPPPPLTETEKLALAMESYDLDYAKIQEYRSTFDHLDIDKNGMLGRGEVRNAFYFWGQEITDGELEDYFVRYDVDKNGFLEFPEFVEMLAEKEEGTEYEKDYAAKMKPYDTSGTGYISREKLYKGLRDIDKDGFDFTQEEMEHKFGSFFKGVNKNENGEVNYMNVIKLLRFKRVLE